MSQKSGNVSYFRVRIVHRVRGQYILILLTLSVIRTVMGGWVNLCDAKKINSKYRFFAK